MKIDLHRITVRDVFSQYQDSAEEGVVGFGGKLDIRPKYQREFVYSPKQRDAVIHSIRNSFPLNVMYWIQNGDDNFELLDGQQRTLSICQYVNGDYSIDDRHFFNLTSEEQDQILNYELMIYFCEGTDKERMEWFGVINTAGEKLTPQELRNAVYTGPWLSDAKLKFSKSNCVAYLLASDGGLLVDGAPIRQQILETALSWINNGEVADYMARHQFDENANELWEYYQNVINWVRKTFTNYRREMNGQQWGPLYNQFKDAELDPDILETEIQKLMLDEDVSNKHGIYPYVLTRAEKHLNIRAFTPNMIREAYERQHGICAARNAVCGNAHFEIDQMEADHITPWSQGGKTSSANCQMLCREDNRRKSDI